MPNKIQNLKFKIFSEPVHFFSSGWRWDHWAKHKNKGVKKNGLASDGFTLIETIIALAVITSAVVGPFSLATKGILNASFAKNKIIAANLSQEGVELVRKIRENNILAGRNWDYGIASGSWQGDIFSSDLSPFSGVPLLFDSATGIYSQNSGIQSGFTRKITITKPSANEISVSSEVSWMERSIDRKIILSEKLYNWR